jgi:hypothetical protein
MGKAPVLGQETRASRVLGAKGVFAPPSDQPDAHGVATGHEPEAVVLDFVNPVRAGRRLVGGGRQARLNEADRQGTQRRQHRLKIVQLGRIASASISGVAR